MITLCGLWKTKTKDGKDYLSGSLSSRCKVLIFPNTKKTNEKQPDFNLCIAEIEVKKPEPPKDENPFA